MDKSNALTQILDYLVECYRMDISERLDTLIVKLYKKMYKLYEDV